MGHLPGRELIFQLVSGLIYLKIFILGLAHFFSIFGRQSKLLNFGSLSQMFFLECNSEQDQVKELEF